MVRMHFYLSARYVCPLATVTFDAGSQGQLAMVIYEWGDEEYLGKDTSRSEDFPVSELAFFRSAFANASITVQNIRVHFQCSEEWSLRSVATGPLHHQPPLWQVNQ